MKRVLLLWVLLFIALKVNGQEVEVSSFSYLSSLLKSNSPQTILLSTGTIVFESNYNDIGIGLKTLCGNNGVLDGRNHTGLRPGSGQDGVGCGEYLNISDVTIQNFTSREVKRYYDDQRGTLALVDKFIFNASGKVNFVKNKAENGGAILVGVSKGCLGWGIKRGDTIANFEEGEFEFVDNRALSSLEGGGGAVYANREARINFINSKVKFTRNRAYNGGGLCIDDSAIATFNNCIVNFIKNGIERFSFLNGERLCVVELIIQDNGGAICVEGGANIAFKDSEVNFTGNGASVSGGAIYTWKARIDFDNSKINFSMNKADCTGGAICVDDKRLCQWRRVCSGNKTRICVNSSEVSFTSNSTISGGAIYMENEGSIIFSNSQVSFVGNTAIKSDGCGGCGGAIYAINSNIKLNGSTRFIDNQAGRKGGGIYIDRGKLEIETVDGEITEFRGNRANGKSNAIHFMDASIKFNIGSRGIVNMYDAITSQDEGGVVNINGQGEFNLSSEEETIIGNLNINDRSKFNVGPGRMLEVLENLTIGEEAELKIGSRDINIILARNYIQNGMLRIEVFGEEEGREWSVCDQIIGLERVELGRNSKMKIEEKGDCRGQGYMLIQYGRLEGRFRQLEIPQEHEIEYGYEGKWIALIPKRRILEARVEEEE